MAKWFYMNNQDFVEHGPISPAEFRELVGSGKINADDRVKREGMENWVRADRIQGLEFVVQAEILEPPPINNQPPIPVDNPTSETRDKTRELIEDSKIVVKT